MEPWNAARYDGKTVQGWHYEDGYIQPHRGIFCNMAFGFINSHAKKYIKPKFKQKKQQKKDVKWEKVLPWLPCGYKINYILRSHVYQDCISILYAVSSLILKAVSVRWLKNLILRKELICDANETLKTLSERPSPNSRRGCVNENLTLI